MPDANHQSAAVMFTILIRSYLAGAHLEEDNDGGEFQCTVERSASQGLVSPSGIRNLLGNLRDSQKAVPWAPHKQSEYRSYPS